MISATNISRRERLGHVRARRLSALLIVASLLVLPACGDDDGNGPEPVAINVAGDWEGSAFTGGVQMSLQQSGRDVTGTFSFGIFGTINAPLLGVINAANEFVWTAIDECTVFSDTMTLSEDGQRLSGNIIVNRNGCNPPLGPESDVLTLIRQ